MTAIFRHTGSVTDGVTLSVTNSHFPMAANGVTLYYHLNPYQREGNRNGHPQRPKALHFARLPNSVAPRVTQNVTPETPINTGLLHIVLHLLHL